jgi:hypothetical protein
MPPHLRALTLTGFYAHTRLGEVIALEVLDGSVENSAQDGVGLPCGGWPVLPETAVCQLRILVGVRRSRVSSPRDGRIQWLRPWR